MPARSGLVTQEQAREAINRFNRRTGTTMRIQARRLGLRSKGPLQQAMIEVLGSEEAYWRLLSETASAPGHYKRQQ